MRVLVVAYDFPPNPSPQSLRWAYLVRELDGLGHEIHVMTVDAHNGTPDGLPSIPDSVGISRVYPGLFTALLLRRRKQHAKNGSTGYTANDLPGGRAPGGHALNWKGRFAEFFKRFLSLFIFPDYRSEWLPWAHRQLRSLLKTFEPDVVVTSHEPASTLPLGLEAKRLGYRWVADLGDPVASPYTLPHWRGRARRLERAVCQMSDLVSVTSEAFAQALADRYGLPDERRLVLPQGYDAEFKANACDGVSFDPGVLELLYTGRLYSFRRADALLGAVVRVPGVRLNIATSGIPTYLRKAAADHPGSVRLLGFVPHRTALGLQRQCDVLVNLANADAMQVPGKVNEYLGSGRPILHICTGEEDATGRCVRALHAGWQVSGRSEEIEACLRRLAQAKSQGSLSGGDRNATAIASYAWQHLAKGLEKSIRRLLPA